MMTIKDLLSPAIYSFANGLGGMVVGPEDDGILVDFGGTVVCARWDYLIPAGEDFGVTKQQFRYRLEDVFVHQLRAQREAEVWSLVA